MLDGSSCAGVPEIAGGAGISFTLTIDGVPGIASHQRGVGIVDESRLAVSQGDFHVVKSYIASSDARGVL